MYYWSIGYLCIVYALNRAHVSSRVVYPLNRAHVSSRDTILRLVPTYNKASIKCAIKLIEDKIEKKARIV